MITPYNIHHVQLQQPEADITFIASQTQAYYLVCWYQSIPLGHLFIEAGEEKNNLRENIWQVILPALKHYDAGQDWVKAAEAFMDKQPAFIHLLENIFEKHLPGEVPATVPVSLIICTANRAGDLENCLQSVMQQTCKPAEIIVVDNAPGNEQTKNVCSRFNVLYCAEPEKGLSYARNTGIKQASQPYISWTDDDVTVHPLWTWNVFQCFQKTGADAVLGLVLAAELETESQQVFEKHWPFNRGFLPKTYDHNWFAGKLTYGPPVWELGAGANMAFRKEVFDKVGLFDVRLGAGTSGCSEDSELWFRMLKEKMIIQYEPRCIVFHTHRREMAKLKSQLQHYMRGFVVAALIQQKQLVAANYKKQLYRVFPVYYARLIKSGFPSFHFRYATLWNELKGVAQGFLYYFKVKNKHPQK